MASKVTSSCLSNEAWAAMKAAAGNRCTYCGVFVERRMAAEHCEPLTRGGADEPENIVPACPRCNNSKKALFLLEWVFVQHGLLIQPVKDLPLRVAEPGREPEIARHLRGLPWVPKCKQPCYCRACRPEWYR